MSLLYFTLRMKTDWRKKTILMTAIVLGRELCLHHLNRRLQVYTESLSMTVASFQILIYMQFLRMPVSKFLLEYYQLSLPVQIDF